MISYFKPALILFTLMTLLTGVAYPLLVTGLSQYIFPRQANGSLITDNSGNVSGSKLIGQVFSNPSYFWGRPSATSLYPYNAGASGGSNLGPTNPALMDVVKARIDALQAADPENKAAIPVDLITASASGLDPHISPAAADYQVGRIARLRNINLEKLRKLVHAHTEDRQWGIFGEPRVNVLALNLALAALH
jgi:K+-transporting ATPase ATPase C chain